MPEISIKNENILSRQEAKLKDALVLAFIGDAVHTLFVRLYLLEKGDYSSGNLHIMSSKICNAYAQERAYQKISAMLSEDEIEIAKRARNHKLFHTPKNADIMAYKNASSYEALVGYLYLVGENEKLNKLLQITVEEDNDNRG